jgi:hypothetical protein
LALGVTTTAIALGGEYGQQFPRCCGPDLDLRRVGGRRVATRRGGPRLHYGAEEHTCRRRRAEKPNITSKLSHGDSTLLHARVFHFTPPQRCTTCTREREHVGCSRRQQMKIYTKITSKRVSPHHPCTHKALTKHLLSMHRTPSHKSHTALATPTPPHHPCAGRSSAHQRVFTQRMCRQVRFSLTCVAMSHTLSLPSCEQETIVPVPGSPRRTLVTRSACPTRRSVPLSPRSNVKGPMSALGELR